MRMEKDQKAKICQCGQPSDGWPGDGDGELCQMCWEAECDAMIRSWWAMMERLDQTLGPVRDV